MIALYEKDNLTTSEMKTALRRAGIALDPFTWDLDTANKAMKILDAAQLRKIRRNLKKQLRKMGLTQIVSLSEEAVGEALA